MKKGLRLLLMLTICCMLLAGCKASQTTENIDAGMQELYDRSLIAKDYAEKSFEKYMEEQEKEYTVEQTSYGFYTSENPVYLIGFQYQTDGETEYYAYKVSVNDDLQCAVLEEGNQVADFLFSEN